MQCYEGNNSIDEGECQFHPGVPIFHEGMKYWSCCNRKTSDFQSFLDQVGCERGAHKWKKEPPKVRDMMRPFLTSFRHLSRRKGDLLYFP